MNLQELAHAAYAALKRGPCGVAMPLPDESGYMHLLVKLPVNAEEFGSFSNPDILCSADSTPIGPAWVCLMRFKVEGGASLVVSHYADPRVDFDFEVIRAATKQSEIIIDCYDPTMRFLGTRGFPVPDEVRDALQMTMAFAAGHAEVPPDPEAIAALGDKDPFVVVAAGLERIMMRHLDNN